MPAGSLRAHCRAQRSAGAAQELLQTLRSRIEQLEAEKTTLESEVQRLLEFQDGVPLQNGL